MPAITWDAMTIRHYLVIGIAILQGCRIPQTANFNNNSDTKPGILVEESWMDYDKGEQVSYVDLYKYGRLKLPGQWKHSNSQPPRYFSYENSENHLLTLDMGLLDTMTFYSKEIAEAELLKKLYEQGIALWRQKDGQIKTIEENIDNTISKLTIDPTRQIFFLCGVKDNKSMTLYLVPKTPDDLKSVDLLRQVFSMWKK